MDISFDLLLKIAIATGSGLVIGLEREFSNTEDRKIMAGFRTFPLISLFGLLSAFFSVLYSHWILIFGFIGVLALVSISKVMAAKDNVGTTTGAAVMISFFIGALIWHGFIILAVTITVIVTFLLSLKLQFKHIAGTFNQSDIYALLQFIVISGIILPVLPDKTFEPYPFLNPREIWYMVVLITGLSFTGYIMSKFIGSEKSILITGIVGSLASTTAITWEYSHKSSDNREFSNHYAVAIIIGSSIMYLRTFLVAFFINSNFAIQLLPPILILATAGLIVGMVIYKMTPITRTHSELTLSNPLNMIDALKFAFLFTLTLFFIHLSRKYLGDSGVYLISALSGSTDVDPTTISLAKMAGVSLSAGTATIAIIVSTLANSVMKYSICILFGSPDLKKKTSFGFGTVMIVGLIYIVFKITS